MNNSRTKSMRIAKLMVRNLLRIKKMITAMMIPVIYPGKAGTERKRRKAPQILKADGSIRENTKKSLHMPLKLHATDMDGSLVIQYTLAMNMIP